MSQSPFYLEHYLDSLETLPGELRRNFTKMTDKDQVLKKDLVQIDSTSDEYLRKVRDLSPTKRKAEMEKIQVSGCDVGWLLCWWIMVLLVIGLSRGLPGSQESQRGSTSPHTADMVNGSHTYHSIGDFSISSVMVPAVHCPTMLHSSRSKPHLC